MKRHIVHGYTVIKTRWRVQKSISSLKCVGNLVLVFIMVSFGLQKMFIWFQEQIYKHLIKVLIKMLGGITTEWKVIKNVFTYWIHISIHILIINQNNNNNNDYKYYTSILGDFTTQIFTFMPLKNEQINCTSEITNAHYKNKS